VIEDSLLSGPDTKKGKLQRACLAILREHQADGALPTSGRFIFYEMLSRSVIPKLYYYPNGRRKPRTPAQDVAEASYHLREVGLVPWEWIVDETRDLASWSYAESVYRYVENGLSHARIDLWDGKPPPLILSESRSLAGVLKHIAGTYLCPIAATNGQVGGFVHTDLGPLVGRANGATQRVFYLGDLDFSGGQIEANTRKVLSRYGDLEWERIAVTEKQAHSHSLTPISKPDKRFRPVRYYDAIETEALKQTEIQRIVTERLDRELPEPLDEVLSREGEQRVHMYALMYALCLITPVLSPKHPP
jgi:hypothetical protein